MTTRRGFKEFETDELRYMIELFGDQHKDSGASALYDEAWREIKARAEDGEREAADIFYNGPHPVPEAINSETDIDPEGH